MQGHRKSASIKNVFIKAKAKWYNFSFFLNSFGWGHT